MEQITDDISKIGYENNLSHVSPMGENEYDEYNIVNNMEDMNDYEARDVEHISNERYYLTVNQDNKVSYENFKKTNKLKNIEHFKKTSDKNNLSFNDILLILVVILIVIIFVNYFLTYCLCDSDDNYDFLKESSSPFDNQVFASSPYLITYR